jgi:hypothetical protein
LRGLWEKPNETEANWKQIKQTQQSKTKRSMLRGGQKKNPRHTQPKKLCKEHPWSIS